MGLHDWLDVGLIVATVAAGCISVFILHAFSTRDSHDQKVVEEQKAHEDRHNRADKRLERHAVEIRHTQREAKIEPFYNDEL